jgi:hypothetical protein
MRKEEGRRTKHRGSEKGKLIQQNTWDRSK